MHRRIVLSLVLGLGACAHEAPPRPAHIQTVPLTAEAGAARDAIRAVLEDRYQHAISGTDVDHITSPWRCRTTDGEPCPIREMPHTTWGHGGGEDRSPLGVPERRYGLEVLTAIVPGADGATIAIGARVIVVQPGATDNGRILFAGSDAVPPWVQDEIDGTAAAIRARLR